MRQLRYHRVDVFTDRPLGGNPLAVFPDGRGLDAGEMQLLAREMNLSETVFSLPSREPGAARRLRIFTIDRELPMAGHPVVGAAHVLASTGAIEVREGLNPAMLELGAATLPVEIHVRNGEVAAVFMTQKTPTIGRRFGEIDLVATALGLLPSQLDLGDLKPRVVDTGIPWFLIPLVDLKALRALRVQPQVCAELASVVGTDLFYAFTQDTGDPSCAARARHVWFGGTTPGEDPVTGSAIGCLASFLVSEGVILAAPEAELSIEQGEEVGRRGKVTARVQAKGGSISRVQVGGSAVHVGDGEIRLP
ncbi:MAG: PhzF family phenazine biosynthesis protein [Planctomycetota bacterium]